MEICRSAVGRPPRPVRGRRGADDGREGAGASFRTGGYTGLPEAELWTDHLRLRGEHSPWHPFERGCMGDVHPGENNALCNDSYTVWSKWSFGIHWLCIFG
ncbi:hypothetical protein GCM10010502_43860 [Kitasatospora aureofaciens]|uniref:Uncharacterized protein n=1 Tax=Kitasatospora aureofaciens TaxID=1894 RepID=A0A8H9HSB1_KITAU|nr:hypothetical protein GCM10010502_43860 [Kitasatospora aureofaciens]